MRVLLGFIIVFITIGIGWIGNEITRYALLLIADLLQTGYFLSHFIIYTLSSIAFAWIAIFFPMIVFKNLNIRVSWKPAIYFLFLWFALIEYQTSIFIFNNNLVEDTSIKLIIILANCFGVYSILFMALKLIDKYSIINNVENKTKNK